MERHWGILGAAGAGRAHGGASRALLGWDGPPVSPGDHQRALGQFAGGRAQRPGSQRCRCAVQAQLRRGGSSAQREER